MKVIVKFRLTSLAFTVITLITIPTVIAGEDSVMSGAIIQAGWCEQGNYICLFNKYLCISALLIFVCLLLDLAINCYIKQRRKAQIRFFAMPIKSAIKDGYQYASIIVKNDGKHDVEEFFGEIIGCEILSEPTQEKIIVVKHNALLESRMWKRKNADYINPNRRPVENDKNVEYIRLDHGKEARFNIAKCNEENGVVILNQGKNKPISGLKKYKNEFKIIVMFYGKNITPIKKIYLLQFSHIENFGMMFDKFEEYNDKR